MKRRQLLCFLGVSVSYGVFAAFNNFTLTLWLSGFTSSYLLLGLMGNTRSFEGTLVAPVVGTWSDRTWLGRLGRRRPFILGGGLTSAVLLALTPFIAAWHAPAPFSWLLLGQHGLLPAVSAIFIFTLTFNAMADVHDALMVDISTPAERNRLAAIRIVVSMTAQVGILVVGFVLWHDSVPAWAFVFVAVVVAAGTLVTAAGVREEKIRSSESLAANQPKGLGLRASLEQILRHNRPAALFCLVVFAYWTGVNAVLPLISIYSRDILHASIGLSQLLPALLLLATTLCAFPAAKLGDRYGRKRVIGAGYGIVAVAGVLALVITNVQEGALVFLLAGLGNAAGQVLTVPLMAGLVLDHEIGAATGILAAAGSLAAPLASLAGGGLADLFGPRAIFGMMAVTVTIAIVVLRLVPDSAAADDASTLIAAIAVPA